MSGRLKSYDQNMTWSHRSGLSESINRVYIDWCPSRQFVSSESCVNCERLNTVPYLLVEILLALQSFKGFIARTLIGTARGRRTFRIGVEFC